MKTSFVLINTLLCIVCLSVRVSAQVGNLDPSEFAKLTDFLPPSPNAYSLGKYGGINVGLSTGTPNFDIPLCTMESIHIKLPISVAYSSNGVRVDGIASQVGTDWHLNAGGVITRTVFGAKDEDGTSVLPPSNTSSAQMREYLKDLSISIPEPSIDGQPDVFAFNFNGYAGKFILDENLHPILLSHSGIKIEQKIDQVDETVPWSFKITTQDGIEYYFGAIGATEFSKSYGSGCGQNYPDGAVTAWYLTKILHPDNDYVTFTYNSAGYNYKTGLSQSAFAPIRSEASYLNPSIDCDCERFDFPMYDLKSTNCEKWLHTSGVFLQEINTSTGTKIKFSYVGRNDIVNDKLLSEIDIFQPNNAVEIKTFKFYYNETVASSFMNYESINDIKLKSRPFLMKISETNASGSIQKNYSFDYNGKEALPPRLSFAQDHYGFFNGKQNATLLPKPELPSWGVELPTATANREIDPNLSCIGMLSKITYPTGGYDNITYESNQAYKSVQVLGPQTTIQAIGDHVDFEGLPTIITSSTANTTFEQEVIFSGACNYNVPPSLSSPTHHDRCRIELFDLTKDANNPILSEQLIPGDQFTDVVKLLEHHDYVIRSTISGQEVHGGGQIDYIPNFSNQNLTVNTGGVRIAKIESFDNVTGNTSIKKYYYNQLTDPNRSSGQETFRPVYTRKHTLYKPCIKGNTNLCWYHEMDEFMAGDGLQPLPRSCKIAKFKFYSIYSSSLNNLYVFNNNPVSYECVIESFGNNFENGGVEHKFTVNQDSRASVLLGEDMMGAPMTDLSFSNGQEIYTHQFKTVGSSKISVKKTFVNYTDDSRISSTIKAYLSNRKYVYPCFQLSPPSSEEFDQFNYSFYEHFVKWIYADNVKTWTYDNSGQNYIEDIVSTEYANPSHALPTKQTTVSSDKKINIVNTYYPQDLTLAGDDEVARQALVSKNITVPLLQTSTKDNNPINSAQTFYYIFPNNLVLPKKIATKKGNATFDLRLLYNKYDDWGNVLERQKANDVVESYIYGYNHLYPVAKIVGMCYDDVLTNSGIDLTKINDISTSDADMRQELSKLRSNLSHAFITTFTYAPIIGITSQTDPAGHTTYYEYDDFNRLKLIKDQDGKIIKKYEYQYQQNP